MTALRTVAKALDADHRRGDARSWAMSAVVLRMGARLRRCGALHRCSRTRCRRGRSGPCVGEHPGATQRLDPLRYPRPGRDRVGDDDALERRLVEDVVGATREHGSRPEEASLWSAQRVASAWIGAISDGAVQDGGDAYGLLVVDELVDDAVAADAQGAQTAQPSSQRMARGRFALELAECVLDRVDERPVKFEQVVSGPSGQNDAGHRRSVGGAAALGELYAQRVERDGVAALEVGQTLFDGVDGVAVGEDLGRLLERLILIDRHERGRWPAIARHEDVIPAISDVVEQFAQAAAKLSHGHVLSHARSVHD